MKMFPTYLLREQVQQCHKAQRILGCGVATGIMTCNCQWKSIEILDAENPFVKQCDCSF